MVPVKWPAISGVTSPPSLMSQNSGGATFVSAASFLIMRTICTSVSSDSSPETRTTDGRGVDVWKRRNACAPVVATCTQY